MSFDPRTLGAQCDKCCLNNEKPVQSEIRPDALATVVVDFPTKDDLELGRIFKGQEAIHFLKHCQAIGATRQTFSYTSALLCRPPQDDMGKLRIKLKFLNKQRAAKGLAPIEDPLKCCAPRLQNEMSSKVIPLGSLALEAVNGSSLSIMKYRGAPIDVPGGRTAVPIFSPGFIQHQQKFTRAYRTDIRRAINFFKGKSEWVEPTIRLRPSVSEVVKFIKNNKRIAHDYETERKGQIRSKVYCLGLSNATEAIVIGFLSIETGQRFYSPQDEATIRAALREAMLDPAYTWIGHNSRIFDDVVSDGFLGCHPVNGLDTIMFHRSAESELPHKLEYVGSVFTPISRAWKATKSGTESKTDNELHFYCATDTVVCYRILEPLAVAVLNNQQEEVVQLDHKNQDICKGMHINGLLVDKKRRNEHDLLLKRQISVNKRIMHDTLGRPKFNAASAVQVRDLLYDEWQLPILMKSKKTGAPSTSAKAIIQLMLEGAVDQKQKIILNAIRKVRRAAALRGTRIARLRTPDEKFVTAFDPDVIYSDDEENEDFEAEENDYREKDADKEPLLHEDGRLHPSWMPHAPVSGRYSGQLVQNWNRKMRDIFIAAQGNVLVGLDADQGELRASTNYSGAKMYVDAFLAGTDPHSVNAKLVFGEEGRPFYEKAIRETAAAWLSERGIVLTGSKLDKQARKDDDDWSRMATFAKIFVFAGQYKAQIEKIFEIIRMTEDDEGNLPYAGLKLGTAVERYDNWLNSVPEFKTWWDRDLKFYRENGFLQEPITGRKRFFLDGENENEIANFLCQSSIAAIMNIGAQKFVEQIPFKGKYGPGLINQVHDALLVEVKAEHAEYVLKTMKDSLTYKHPTHVVPYTFSGKIGVGFIGKGADRKQDPISRWSYTE